MVRSRARGLRPSPTESAPCGSMSTRSTWRPCSARAAPRLMVVVVLPTPPFWFARAMTFPIYGTSGPTAALCRHIALSTRKLDVKWLCVLADRATSGEVASSTGWGRAHLTHPDPAEEGSARDHAPRSTTVRVQSGDGP